MESFRMIKYIKRQDLHCLSEMDCAEIVPYTCVYLDASWGDLMKAMKESAVGCGDRTELLMSLTDIWTKPADPQFVLTCLSVRTALDLYLRIQKFPQGSEMIMSAINIPDMIRIVQHHGIKVVPLDIDIDTMAPRVELLENLISEKTVGLIVAHVYGKWVDMEPFISIAQKYDIKVIEDCAETFCGFERTGHVKSDLSLFSFGAIKFYTAFGGCIAKVKDKDVFTAMVDLYRTYPIQGSADYFKKVLKYSAVYLFVNCPSIVKPGMYVTRTMGIDHKKHVVKLLRGFPDKLIDKIRQQPCTALLRMMHHRFTNFSSADMELCKMKCDYVSDRLPEKVTQVGTRAFVKNYWLFPIVVENPDEVLKALNALGVDAYRGATQLNIIEPENGNTNLKHLEEFVKRYPHEAKFLIDHVVYLPVNKLVPFCELDRICKAVDIAIQNSNGRFLPPVVTKHKLASKTKLPSKL